MRPSLLAVLAFVAAIWALLVRLTGGFVFSVAGVQISSTDPIRPLVAALIAIAAYAVLSALAGRHPGLSALTRRVGPRGLAAVLALGSVVTALSHASWTAGGADEYSYVSQADLWLQRKLTVPMPIATAVPWPDGLATFTPLGYGRPAEGAAIAPVTGPGLPLMMAALKSVAGHCAAFWIVPLTAGLLVWATFALGRKAGSDVIALGAAWLVATSPTVLAMAKSPMSDIPAAAFWTQAAAWVVGASLRASIAAGLAASMAVLIRPNLAPLAAVMAVWLLWRDRSPARAVAFVCGVLPGCLAVALLNNVLYGSPFSSGYGDLNSLLSVAHIPANLARYGRWLIETQTPLAVAGMLALATPTRVVWPTDDARRAAFLLASITVVVWAMYCVYIAFDAWWFLRFLLPCWAAISIGTAALVVRLGEWTGGGQRVAVLALIALGLYAVVTAIRHDVFPAGEGDRRYATIASLVERTTEPSSVILTSQHSGSIRYYAGRLTLRFDLLDPAWLDRAIAWLDQQGRRPYILVEDWEMKPFEERFAERNALGRLALAPVLAYRAYRIPGTIYLFDPRRPEGPTLEPPPVRDPRPRCVAPAAEPAPR